MSKIVVFRKQTKLVSKIAFFVKNRSFCQKTKLVSKNEISVKNLNLCLKILIGVKKRSFCQSLKGPTLPSLAQNVGHPPSDLGWIFSVRSIGFIIGSALPALLRSRLDDMLGMTFATFLSGISRTEFKIKFYKIFIENTEIRNRVFNTNIFKTKIFNKLS